jgi:peptidase E
MEMMLALPGVGSPRVAYLGAANGDDESFFRRMEREFLAAGSGPVEAVRLTGNRVSETARHALERADIVFVSGGDVEEGMRVVRHCGADQLLRDLFEAGKPVMGLSAGSIMLGREWVRWRDPDDDATAEIFPCLGFAPFACDTHDEESGWEELRHLLSLSPDGTTGYGIPSGAGLVVEADGEIAFCGTPAARYEKSGRTVRRLPAP